MIHSPFVTSLFIWVGIAFCIIQSAIFSGLNLAIFSVSKLRLEVEAAGGNRDAISLLGLRKDSNLTLSAVLWGNVTINVLLTLLSDSVLAGVGAFAFSTFVITLFGEIIPQAYFSRHALRMAARLTPLLKVYQVVLFPVAKPTAIFLNWWLGPEGITFLRERDFRAFITRHVGAAGADVLEAIGALNFLDLDDIAVLDEGEPVGLKTNDQCCRSLNARQMIHFCCNCISPARSGSSLSMPQDSHVWCWMRITFCATRSSMKYF
jgi:metal transporter CNNM